MQVNRELIIYCLQSIAQKGPCAIAAETLIHALSAFQSGIELMSESQHIRTYKVGNMAFKLFCLDGKMVDMVMLYEKDGQKVYYIDLLANKFFMETDHYPDCLKD